jgi:hypothetical protein
LPDGTSDWWRFGGVALDRLRRSLPDLVKIIANLERQDIGFESLTEKFEAGSAWLMLRLATPVSRVQCRYHRAHRLVRRGRAADAGGGLFCPRPAESHQYKGHVMRNLLAILLLVALPAHAEAPGDFAYAASVEVSSQEALLWLELPSAVYEGAVRTDLGDLRVFNAAGEVVPHAFLPQSEGCQSGDAAAAGAAVSAARRGRQRLARCRRSDRSDRHPDKGHTARTGSRPERLSAAGLSG